jgi:hypothetical protein
MFDQVEILLPVALFVAAAIVFLWHRHAFIVRIKQDEPRVLKGKVTAAFLHDVMSICHEAGIRRGWLGGLWRGKRIVLVFSWHFPPRVRQRLRNLWLLHA